ncbi:proline-serine-threonine phosphatase-interacting protein 2-like [Dendronephthya gigantea]|uniref:proline-serine-threonine phosphatase-interacting protein 2-like n=1 Tax=Dendronephthya gigantea TaxID=151771 RepID=UPI00106D0D5C|nr:proline-serine-threonine phosphatase-interacting protein 2-like [Dendronephthya gigantea]
MTKTRFVDCFWGSDFNSTTGFDVLCKRVKDGRQMCVDYEEFIKQRAEAEERYGKALLKLAKTGENGVEIGTLRQSWDVLRQETESMGRAHLEFSQQLIDQIDREVREFREDQKNKRKPIEENVKKLQKEKRNCFENNVKAKRNYEQKCREHDQCEDTLKKSASQQSKEEEKLRVRLSKAKTAVENADANYQSTVRALEESRKEWEREMTTCCNTFQELETERISFLRNSMWTYTNLGSTNCVRVDQHCEEVRKSLEQCDINSDLHLFLSAKQTGCERPAEIFYENFYTTQSNQKTGLQSSQRQPNYPMAKVSLPPTPTVANTVPKTNVIDYGDDIEEDPTYSTVQDLKKRTEIKPPTKYVKADFPYDAQGSEELSFREGDVIKVLREEDSTWWCGEIRGRKGMFPREFVSSHRK